MFALLLPFSLGVTTSVAALLALLYVSFTTKTPQPTPAFLLNTG